MAKLLKCTGGSLTRMLQAIDGFRAKHGCWPKEIWVHREELVNICEYHLTEEGVRRLLGFVTIVPRDRSGVFAKGPGRRSFDYGKEGWGENQPVIRIAELLGLEQE